MSSVHVCVIVIYLCPVDQHFSSYLLVNRARTAFKLYFTFKNFTKLNLKLKYIYIDQAKLFRINCAKEKVAAAKRTVFVDFYTDIRFHLGGPTNTEQ
jgi:hypothetical protein